MKIYEYIGEGTLFCKGEWRLLKRHTASKEDWREINHDPTIAHTIELDSCNAVITAESCYFRDAAAPVLTLEEMQRVTSCMEMLKEVNSN